MSRMHNRRKTLWNVADSSRTTQLSFHNSAHQLYPGANGKNPMAGPITSKKVAAIPSEKISAHVKPKEMPLQPNLPLRFKRKVFHSSILPSRTTNILRSKLSMITERAHQARQSWSRVTSTIQPQQLILVHQPCLWLSDRYDFC